MSAAPSTPRSSGPQPSGSYLGLLRHNRDFRLLFTAVLISFAGDWFLAVALLDLVLEMTGKAALAALINLCTSLPVFLVSPWAGALADRIDRRKLMIGMDLLRAGAALLPLLSTRPQLLVFAYLGTIIISVGSAYFDPAADAALPNLVAPEDLGRANVLLGSAWGTMMAIGSALGGVVTLYLGRNTAFMVDAASFVISALLVMRVRAPFATASTLARTATSLRESIAETLRYTRQSPKVLALLLSKGGYALGAGLVALLGLFGTKVFHRGPDGISMMLIARGVGALSGPFLLGLLVGYGPKQYRAIAFCVGLFGLGYLGLAASSSIAWGMLAVSIAHMGGGAQWQASTFGLQNEVPDHLRGRIFAADYGLLTLMLSISTGSAGLLADRFGARPVTTGFAMVAISWALIWGLWTRRLWTTPAPKLSVVSQSTPSQQL